MPTDSEYWRAETVQLATDGVGFLTTAQAGEHAITMAMCQCATPYDGRRAAHMSEVTTPHS